MEGVGVGVVTGAVDSVGVDAAGLAALTGSGPMAQKAIEKTCRMMSRTRTRFSACRAKRASIEVPPSEPAIARVGMATLPRRLQCTTKVPPLVPEG